MKAAVLGHPIAHSLSPTIHQAAYTALNLPHTYTAQDIEVTQFQDFLSSCDSSWMGLSLTMPLKEIVMTVADHFSADARLAECANTLIFQDGLHAHNTDVYGITQAFSEIGVTSAESMAIIGSGATARSAVLAARDMGVDEIVIIARNRTAAGQCLDLAVGLGITPAVVAPPDADFDWAHVTVNTTPAHAMDDIAHTISAVSGPLLDVVYSPWPTQLASHWEKAGGVTCAGHIMLLHQAAAQFTLMTGVDAPVEAMRSALMTALS